MRTQTWLAIAAALPVVASALNASALSLNRAVQPPPPSYAAGPTLYGQTTERTFDEPLKVQRFCEFYLGRPAAGYYQACYIPAMDLVVLPDRHAWPSAKEREELRAHEWAHARGWRHPAAKTASIY